MFSKTLFVFATWLGSVWCLRHIPEVRVGSACLDLEEFLEYKRNFYFAQSLSNMTGFLGISHGGEQRIVTSCPRLFASKEETASM